MNKIIKSRIFAFIFGAVIFSGITGVAAYNMLAKNIKYTPSDSAWKKANGEDITNVEEAIDELFLNNNSFDSIYYTSEEYSHIRTANLSLELPFGNYICFYNAFRGSYDIGNLDKHVEIANDSSKTVSITGCDFYENLETHNFNDTPKATFEKGLHFDSETYKVIFKCKMNDKKILNIKIPMDSAQHASVESFVSCVPTKYNN